MNTFEKLEALTALAEQNESLRRRLLETRAQRNPCRVLPAGAGGGVALTPRRAVRRWAGVFRQPVQEHKRRKSDAVRRV